MAGRTAKPKSGMKSTTPDRGVKQAKGVTKTSLKVRIGKGGQTTQTNYGYGGKSPSATRKTKTKRGM